MYGWVPLLSLWNYQIVNQLHSNIKQKVKKKRIKTEEFEKKIRDNGDDLIIVMMMRKEPVHKIFVKLNELMYLKY